MKIRFKAISLVGIAILLGVSQHDTVSAASVYDNIVINPASWEVVDNNGDAHNTNLGQAINNISNSQQKAECETIYSKFMQMDYRSYDVYQPNRYGVTRYARAFATNETPGETQWSTEADGMKRAHALWHNYVAFQLKYDDDKVVAFDCGESAIDGYGDISYAMAYDDGFTPVREYQTQNFAVNYPPDYAGNSIPSSSIGGLISGNVQCTNTSNVISAVHINAQSGLSGNAKITDDGIGGKNYRYYLSEESPYSLIVLCDGDSFYGPTVESSLYYNYNWVCTHTGDLNVCAAS